MPKKTPQPKQTQTIGSWVVQVYRREKTGPRGRHLGWSDRWFYVDIYHAPTSFDLYGNSFENDGIEELSCDLVDACRPDGVIRHFAERPDNLRQVTLDMAAKLLASD